MSRFTSPGIPPVTDVAGLQKAVVIAFQNLIDQLNKPSTDVLDMGNNRIINVAWPSLGGDAVPLDYLRKIKPKGTETSTAGGAEHFGIVFSGTATVSTGDVIPRYPAPKNRTGTPAEIVLYATTAPSSAALQMQISVDGTNLLGSSGITLGTSSNGPVNSIAFVARPKIKHDSVVKATVLAGGGAADVTIVLSVSRGG